MLKKKGTVVSILKRNRKKSYEVKKSVTYTMLSNWKQKQNIKLVQYNTLL